MLEDGALKGVIIFLQHIVIIGSQWVFVCTECGMAKCALHRWYWI